MSMAFAIQMLLIKNSELFSQHIHLSFTTINKLLTIKHGMISDINMN